ncbi:hypothetical protein GKQ77_19790 [Streptomyces sp. BG9H]|uniref:Tetrapyrrole methylase domain-containing protein n=1 Tax=Streptomyces anatolicus TaxID=2675858 RepID=A0ABS6YQW3_9ACTN|nr:hypothetical protein [Streptomyces anatolicus]MBW5423778.1 hypothetical protein [Streptomyces anatolicus]
MTASGTRTSLVGMEVFRAAAGIRHLHSVDVAGETHPLSPVSGGFVTLRPRGFKEDMTAALGALGWGRPVAYVEDTCGLAEFTAAATESEYLPATADSAEPVAFVVPTLFRSRRAGSIERRLTKRSATALPRPQAVAPGDAASRDAASRGAALGNAARRGAGHPAKPQRVRAVGVGPWTPAGGEDALGALETGCPVVMTDWTYRHTFTQTPGHERFRPHVLPYRYGDFDQNIDQVDEALSELHAAGHDRVGLLVEGNPDTYDVLDGLPLTGREIHVTPGVPIGLLAAAQTARHFREDPFDRSFAYLSGLHGRHSLPPQQFLGELTSYLSAGITCVLVEMHKGDVELALEAVRLCGQEKSAVLMSNHFSSEEETIFLPGTPEGLRAGLPADRGGLSTLLIADGGLR